MRHKAIASAILLVVMLLLLVAPAAQAMSSAHYALDWIIPLCSGGGGMTASSHYAAHYSAGQVAVGAMDSASYAVNLGFWQRLAQLLQVYLPAIFR